MSIMKTLNPWGALRAAEDKLRDMEVALRNEGERAERFSLLAIGRAHEIARMQKVMKHCHYRDPDTGRIGKRGEMPK